MENKIINIAREVFIEKGFTETSMSEIATRANINRPTLHYYFRTKEKMFQAIFGSIIQTILPKVFDALTNRDESISQRIGCIVDAYYAIFLENPSLPMFILREVNRDPQQLIHTVCEIHAIDPILQALTSLQEEMNQGQLKQVPLQFVFYNFYSLLLMPFLTYDFSQKVFHCDEANFKTMLMDWRQNIIDQMEHLLCVASTHSK
jgi:AcrR family transcriptional regulator